MNQNIPEEILSEFTSLLEKLGIQYVVIGGLAVSSWHAERFTHDMDLTIAMDEKQWSLLQKELSSSPPFEIKTTFFEAADPIPHLVRILYKNYPIDLLVALTPLQQEIIQRKIRTKVFGPEINLATPEDVILLKLIAKRTQDIADIEMMLQKFSDLDFAYIEKWAKEWEALELWKKLLKKGND